MSQTTSPFGREVHHGEPVFAFPGDEAVSGAAYAACLDNWYATILPELAIGATAYGIHLDEAALERGRRMLSGQFWLDEWLDGVSGERDVYERLVNSLPAGSDPVALPDSSRPELATAFHLLKGAVHSLPPDTQQEIVAGGLSVSDLTARQVATSSLRAYAKLRREEGKVSGRLIAQSFGLPPDKSSEAYTRWLERVVASLSLADHACDLPEDYDDGRTEVMPTTINRLRLLAAAVGSISLTLTSWRGIKATHRAFDRPTVVFEHYLRLTEELVLTPALSSEKGS